MMYLPLKEGQPDLHKYFIELFDLVMPEKVAEEVVARDVKLIFDPVTKDLIKVIMLFASKTEVMTMTLDNGWVTEASVEDTKLLPGVLRTIFRLQGGEWVTREIVKDVQSGRAKFVVNSGDAVWWGNQGRTVTDSPYWKRVNETMLKKLPAPDDEMRAAGLGPTILWVRISLSLRQQISANRTAGPETRENSADFTEDFAQESLVRSALPAGQLNVSVRLRTSSGFCPIMNTFARQVSNPMM